MCQEVQVQTARSNYVRQTGGTNLPITNGNAPPSIRSLSPRWLELCLESDRPGGQTVHPRGESHTGLV